MSKSRKRHIKKTITTIYEDMYAENGLETVSHTTTQPLFDHFESVLHKLVDTQISNLKLKLQYALEKYKVKYDNFTFSGKIYQHEDIDIGYDYVEDNGYGIAITIYGHRTETDKEYERRLARENKKKLARENKKKAEQDKKLEKERALYLQLKEKFENE